MAKFFVLMTLFFGVLVSSHKVDALVGHAYILKDLQTAQNSPWDPGSWENEQNSDKAATEPTQIDK